ncbi:cadherin-23-like [Ochlerotatus camptorhynchus]|uniref:cadherin-23-like n=1 Tax=Ochlerotatus camptorhynchus TaxID=644619 RepID=UPI0031CF2513
MTWKKCKTTWLLLLTTLFSPNFAFVLPGEWDEPYFTSLVPDKVIIGPYDQILREQSISMWEEMLPPIRILQVNYKGSNIKIQTMPSHLGAKLIHENGKWYIDVNNRMDFEQYSHRLSLLTLLVENDVKNTVTVAIRLINILDNAPSMTSEGPCKVPEHKESFLSDCSYKVYHGDGFVTNEIEGKYTNRLDFELPDEEAEFFEMKEVMLIDDYNKRFQLWVLKELDYTQQAMFNFPATVFDFNRTNNFTLNIVVPVQNVESRPPIFTRPFTTRRIPEKAPFSTVITAIDGDTGLNSPICYELVTENEAHTKYFSIELDDSGKNGNLLVDYIDRDEEKNEFYQFTINAFKCHNRLFNTTSEAAIILDDINDHAPTFDVEPDRLIIRENTLMELPLVRFNIEDVDLGNHATYDVSLQEIVPGAETFSIIPSSGYQLASFTLTIVNASQLDYELPERQRFNLIVTATEAANSSHTNQQILAIELLNWNDEVPAFDKDIYEVSIDETIGKDVDLLTVHVTDRDIDDSVQLQILSRIGDDLNVTVVNNSVHDFPIPTFSFRISTAREGIFDWDVAQEVIVQLQAEDTLQTDERDPLHKVFAQVVITVRDINNKPPSIAVPRGRIHIEENSEPNTVAKIGDAEDAEDAILIGTDPDSDADLKFSIDWQSSYAVKGGTSVDPEVFKDCLVIEVDSSNRNRVTGKIRVNPELDQETINQRLDHEAYETLFLTIRLVDEKQVILPGDTEAIVVLQIDNVNDNEPEFVGNTLAVERFVMEEAETGTIVGSIVAIDRDGDEITYTITAENPDQEGLIAIGSTGMLTVNATENTIDCDVPKTYKIPLLITLTDGVYVTNGSIEIFITDTNNKIPSFSSGIPSQVLIFEKSPSGTEILQLNVEDLDRDEPFDTVGFEIDFRTFPDLQNYFEISRLVDDSGERLNQSGLVLVKDNNRQLDRDTGTDRFTINVKVQDNNGGTGRRNSNETSFSLILLDINDHEPVLPALPELKLSEDTKKGTVLVDRFEATDLDDPNTPNAQINYRIIKIEAAGDNSPEAIGGNRQDSIDNLFVLTQPDEYVARLTVGQDLKGFYGSWAVQIEACDRGDEYSLLEDSPRLCNSATYTVLIDPVNYMAPVINFPRNDERIRLKFESLTNGRPLVNTQGETVPNFSATDTDGGAFGVVTFSLQSQDESTQDHVFFQLNPIDKHTVQLVLVNADAIEARSYRVIVNARDGGDLSGTPVSVVIAFINMTGEPEFQPEDSPFQTDFTENEEGMEEKREIPEAIDPKNAELPPEEHKNVFYFIDPSYGTASHLFQLDKETRILQLTQELDREEIPSYEILVLATNNINGPTGPLAPDSRSQLIVHIKVNDVNDNPPKFRIPSYSAGITTNDYPGKILFEVIADDPDEDDVMSYSIDEGTLEVHGENLPTSPFPFGMGRSSGQLSLAVQMQDRMNGFYTFTIVAKDLVDHNDTSQVKIYLIAESNRVTFVFLNNVQDIATQEMKDFLKTEFTKHYEMVSNIDDVVQGSIEGNTRADGDSVTDVRAHFIQNDEAVQAVVIQQRSNDRVFVTNLKTTLSTRQLFLQDVPVTSVEFLEEKSGLLQTILIVVASALAFLCVILLVAFCIKIRSLSRQLKAMSATDFGSIASDDINVGAGRKVPTTNVFSVEGSNPVLNDREFTKGAFDDVSVQSYESDFVGIDNDIFATTLEKDGLNPALMDHIRQRSLNPMVNGGAGDDTGPTSNSKPDPPARQIASDNDDELAHRF